MPDYGLAASSAPAGVPAAAIRFFLSYRRRAERDAALAQYLGEELSAAGHDVFIDVGMKLGTRWSDEISRQIEACDCLVVVLSADTIQSEMVLAEVRLAHQRWEREGRPLILPVRVDYTGPLGYELGAFLDPLQYALWHSPADNVCVRDAILHATSVSAPLVHNQGPDVPPVSYPLQATSHPQPSVDRRAFLNPSGSMPPDDPFYMRRGADEVVDRIGAEHGTTLVVKAPRQMGKSSLLIRYLKAWKSAGKRLAFIDLQGFSEAQLAEYRHFLACFAEILLQRLRLHSRDLPKLESGLDMTNLVEDRILYKNDQPLLLALDETDRLLGRPWQTDFFGMLRTWHNSRWQDGWSDLGLALVIATEPYLLVASEHQSPFNVGEVVTLPPFELTTVLELNRRYGEPLRQTECAWLHELLHGHPYLTRVALHRLVTNRGLSADKLAETADQDDGPFGDHLKAMLLRLSRAGLAETMRAIIRYGKIPEDDRMVFYRLKGAGLAVEDQGRIAPANLLYARFFDRVLRSASV
jgi:hypothetical protein